MIILVVGSPDCLRGKPHGSVDMLLGALVICRNSNIDKVSICFATTHEVGSLYKVLAVLAAYNVNLTKIQSAPIIGTPWEYRFFVDFVVDGELGYEQAIAAIRPITRELQILGTYRRGEHFEY